MEVKNYYDILTDLTNWFITNQNKITDFNDGSIINAMFGAFSSETEKLYLATKLGFVQNLRNIPYSVFDFKRKEGTYATGTVVFSRASAKDFETIIPAETEISGSGRNYITTEIGKITANSLESTPITVRSVEIGSDNNIEANNIDTIVSVLSSDIVAVRNDIKIGGGCDEETEIEMLKRFKDFIAGLQGTSKYGMKSAAENIPGVRSVNVVEDFSGSDIYQVKIYAEDGSGSLASDVKQKIIDVIEGDGTSPNPGKRAPGINVLVTNPESVPVSFSIKATVSRIDSEIAKAEIKNTVREYINGLSIGDDVILTSVMLKVRSLSYVQDVSISSPTENIIIANNQIARFNNAIIDL